MSATNHVIRVLLFVLIGSVTAYSGAVVAQSSDAARAAPAVPESLSPDAVNALVEKLDPEEVAALGHLMTLLGESADAATGQAGTETDTARMLQEWLTGLEEHFVSNLLVLPEMASGVLAALGTIFDGRDAGGSIAFLGILLLALALGAGAHWLFNRVTAGARQRILDASPGTLWRMVRTLGLRTLNELGGLVAFAVTALVANRLLSADPTDRALTAGIVLLVILVPRVVAALMRLVLAPKRPDLRLVSTDDGTARQMYRGLVSISVFIGVAFFLLHLMERNGIMVTGPLRFWVGLIFTGWLIWVIWRSRSGLTEILKGGEEELTPGLERMAAWWPWFTVAIVGLNWLFVQFVISAGNVALSPARSALALVLVIVAPFLDTMVRGVAAHMVPPMEGEGPVAEEAHQETRLSYVRIGRVFLFAALVIAIGWLWGISLQNLAGAGLGARLAGNLAGFLLILAAGYLAWEVLNLWVNRQLAREMPAEEHGEGAEMGGAGGSRLATILPMLRVTLQITVITLTSLLALSHVGVNITPLLAGAGVFGLAIGFGAQTLVKDIVSGGFYLMEDAFRVGEYIDVGSAQGTVEKISLRSLTLRGARGPVHIVPYGDMSKLTNLSRDWVIMKLSFTVPFDTDLEKVRKIFKKIGQELAEDPEHAENLLAPFKSQGAADVTDVGIVIRGKFTAKPGTQFMIRKELYTRVQRAFEENGIEFARREVRVRMPESPDEGGLNDDQKAAISGAVSEAAQTAAEAEAPVRA